MRGMSPIVRILWPIGGRISAGPNLARKSMGFIECRESGERKREGKRSVIGNQ